MLLEDAISKFIMVLNSQMRRE